MTGYSHWWKDVGAGVMNWSQTSLANPFPVQVAGFAFDGDFVVDLDREVEAVAGTIAINASLSAAIDISSGRLVGLKLPAVWDAADITFQGSMDEGATYAEIFDGGVARSIPAADVAAAAGGVLSLDAEDWRAFTHIKIRSGTAGAAVNQTVARAFQAGVEGGI